MSPISALQRLWRAVCDRPAPVASIAPGQPSYADFVALWPDLTVTECALAAEPWAQLTPPAREWAYEVAVRRAIGRKGRERFGAMKRFLVEREFSSTAVIVARRAAGTVAELACIALFVAMVWTWAAIGAGA